MAKCAFKQLESWNDVNRFQLGDLVEKPSYTEKMGAEVMMMMNLIISYHKDYDDDHNILDTHGL